MLAISLIVYNLLTFLVIRALIKPTLSTVNMVKLASVPGLPRYMCVLICGGRNNAVNLKTGRGRPGLKDHVLGI